VEAASHCSRRLNRPLLPPTPGPSKGVSTPFAYCTRIGGAATRGMLFAPIAKRVTLGKCHRDGTACGTSPRINDLGIVCTVCYS
jgi:hypothetical protein